VILLPIVVRINALLLSMEIKQEIEHVSKDALGPIMLKTVQQ
jgi:hypothetical protein